MSDHNATELTAAEHAQAMASYIEAGAARALELGNRGPLTFTKDGALEPSILEAYWLHGFYVFEGVIQSSELRLST